MPKNEPPTAWSTSASAKTTFGDLPPSSSEIFFRLPDAACMIVLPTAVEPVNATLSTFGLAASSAPTTAPGPVTTLITPAGAPASAMMRASSNVVPAVNSDGFATMVHPAASAGASFQVIKRTGKFHGVSTPTTPTGSCTVRPTASG